MGGKDVVLSLCCDLASVFLSGGRAQFNLLFVACCCCRHRPFTTPKETLLHPAPLQWALQCRLVIKTACH